MQFQHFVLRLTDHGISHCSSDRSLNLCEPQLKHCSWSPQPGPAPGCSGMLRDTGRVRGAELKEHMCPMCSRQSSSPFPPTNFTPFFLRRGGHLCQFDLITSALNCTSLTSSYRHAWIFVSFCSMDDIVPVLPPHPPHEPPPSTAYHGLTTLAPCANTSATANGSSRSQPIRKF